MKGRVELADRATGRSIKAFKIECDDDTRFPAGDGMLAYAKLGASFLPFGMLIESAMEIGEGAMNKRPRAEEMLTRGFVMLSYKKAYGNGLYKSFAKRRKVDAELAKTARTSIPVGARPNGASATVSGDPTPVAAPTAAPGDASARTRTDRVF